MSNVPQSELLAALMKSIAQMLVDNPAQVLVEVIDDGDKLTLRLQVAASDMGNVIGKHGHTARSLRTILTAAGKKQRPSFALDIVDGSNNCGST